MQCPKCQGLLVIQELHTLIDGPVRYLLCLNCGHVIHERRGTDEIHGELKKHFRERTFKGKKLPDEIKTTILELRKQNLSYEAIGKRVGVSGQSVMNCVRKKLTNV